MTCNSYARVPLFLLFFFFTIFYNLTHTHSMTTTAHDLPKQSQRQRSKRIELAIVPGRSLGPFRLGIYEITIPVDT